MHKALLVLVSCCVACDARWLTPQTEGRSSHDGQESPREVDDKSWSRGATSNQALASMLLTKNPVAAFGSVQAGAIRPKLGMRSPRMFMPESETEPEAIERERQAISSDIEDTVEDLISHAAAIDRKSVPAHAQKDVDDFKNVLMTMGALAMAVVGFYATPALADAAVSPYSKLDKSGPIGFLATFVEAGIDLAHNGLSGMGMTSNTYGISIILFTLAIKLILAPITIGQLETTGKMSKLKPIQDKIAQRFNKPNQEKQKNELTAQLFQAAQVNPLAGCLPALAQLPVFLSLYRALTNLVAQDKLQEGFLWIPNLEGPIYSKPPGEALSWFTSIFSFNPVLGWADTAAFLTLPVLLFFTQSFATSVLQPTPDPKKPMTDQEEMSRSVVKIIPFMISFFSLQAPAGLAIYWLFNNLITTGITLAARANQGEVEWPDEVNKIIKRLEEPAGTRRVASRVTTRGGGGGMGSRTTSSGVEIKVKKPKRDPDALYDPPKPKSSPAVAAEEASVVSEDVEVVDPQSEPEGRSGKGRGRRKR